MNEPEADANTHGVRGALGSQCHRPGDILTLDMATAKCSSPDGVTMANRNLLHPIQWWSISGRQYEVDEVVDMSCHSHTLTHAQATFSYSLLTE